MKRKLFTLGLLVLSLVLAPVAATPVLAGPASPPGANTPWWQHAVFYEIYPRSFADSNGDGIGDLNGITGKLDYLKDLGIDAIWLTPIYPSPQVDFGYDISDYRNIAPEYGTLADFDHLIAEAKKRNIRIIMDLVMNHTSDKHPWFVQSRSSRNNPKRNWYIWRNGKPLGASPCNWLSLFGRSAWKFDPKTKQYYYHFFYPQQPDLNWRNPAVREAMYDVARFWLNRGVAGFRLDALSAMFEDPKLKDNPVGDGLNFFGDQEMENKYNEHLPEVHQVLKELRHVLDGYPGDRVLIGETSGRTLKDDWQMYGAHNDEIQLPMNFHFAYIDRLSPKEFRRQIEWWNNNPTHGWPLYLFGNHDKVREINRYGDGEHNNQIAKILAAILMTLRGTPMLYYGEEIGMENNDPKSVKEVLDPIGKIGWPEQKGRDGERTPMQWDDSTSSGFSTAEKTWLPVSPTYKQVNVAAESKDPNSLLNFYRRLLQIRRTEPALLNGSYIPILGNNPHVLAYLRKIKDSAIVVMLNLSPDHEEVLFDPSNLGFPAVGATTLISSPQSIGPWKDLKRISLPPWAIYVGEIK